MSTSIGELVFSAVALAAEAAAFSEFENSKRDRCGRNILDFGDELDAARERIGGPAWRLKAFFGHLRTDDLQAVLAIYYAHRDNQSQSPNNPEDDLKDALRQGIRRGSEPATRERCLQKLNEVMPGNIVYELVRGLWAYGDAAEKIRPEFSKF